MRGERGFTLVEVFMASSIVTMVLIAISTLFVLSMKLNAASGDYTEAVALAQERMERLKDTSYEALTAGGSVDSEVTGYFENIDVDSNGTNDFRVTWEVADDVPVALCKQIRVRAQSLKSANAQLGPAKKVTFSTYKAKGGSL